MAKKTTKKTVSKTGYPWTIVKLAKHLGMTDGSFRVWKIEAEKKKLIKKPAIGSALCIQDPDSKNRLLYSDKYLAEVQDARKNIGTRKTRSPKAKSSAQVSVVKSGQTVTLKVRVPKLIADLLNNGHLNIKGVESLIVTHLKDTAKELLK